MLQRVSKYALDFDEGLLRLTALPIAPDDLFAATEDIAAFVEEIFCMYVKRRRDGWVYDEKPIYIRLSKVATREQSF